MELRLQKFVNSMVTLSDIRNLDLSNPVIFSLEHPVTALRYTVVVAEEEPSYMGVPINVTWVVVNINSQHHLKCLKLLSADAPTVPLGDAILLTGMRQSWSSIDLYADIFSTPQYYDNGASGGVRGPKGDTGPIGLPGARGDAGAPGISPILDEEAVILEVLNRMPTTGGAVPTLEIVGPATVLEGTTAQYVTNVVLGTDRYQLNAAPALGTTTAATITASGLLTATAVAADTNVNLTASISYGGLPVTAQKVVSISNASLTSISMTGLPTTLYEGRTAQLVVSANYGSGATTNVTVLTTFAVSAGAGIVSSSGLFTASLVAATTPFTITASYMENSILRTVDATSSVLNLAPVSAVISGPTSVPESTTAQYSFSITKTDGSTAAVTPTWTVTPSAAGSISASGLFTALAATADTAATITASYTSDGATVTDTHAITVTNTATVVYPYYGAAATSAVINSALILGLASRGTTGTRASTNIQILDSTTTSLYYAYPVSYGPATFTDLGNGFQGGWDGAYKDSGNTAGPVTTSVIVDGVATPFYVYQADYPNISPASNPTNWTVT